MANHVASLSAKNLSSKCAVKNFPYCTAVIREFYNAIGCPTFGRKAFRTETRRSPESSLARAEARLKRVLSTPSFFPITDFGIIRWINLRD